MKTKPGLIDLFVVSINKDTPKFSLPNNFKLHYAKSKNYKGHSLEGNADYQCVVLYSDKSFEDSKDEYIAIKKYFKRLPLVFIGKEKTDLSLILKPHVPLFMINSDDIGASEVICVLNNLPGIRKFAYKYFALEQDVESTQLVADLNIERLHKTLKDLESEKEKVETANRAKQNFLASVTHELRTPLTAILGFVDLFDTKNLTGEQLNNMAAIKEASANLLVIVNDVLNFSKLEEGKLAILKEPFNIYKEIKSVGEVLQPKLIEKGLSYDFEFEISKDSTVVGDKFRLKQILTNLICNAIKFTEQGGVSLRVKKGMGSNVIFEVKDTGIGIQQSKLDTIFDSFSQAEDGTTSKYGGTGLGLAIVKKIIHLQGGEIQVASQPNEGSVFTVQLNLPEIDHEISEENILPNKEVDLTDLSILAVEDNYLNQMLLQKLLTTKVSNLVIAGDGETALELCETQKFDVILMDLQLPRMNGIEVVSNLRLKGLNKTTPVAVITANIWEEQLEKIRQVGIFTIIQKPFVKEEMFNQIYRLSQRDCGDLISLEYLNEISGNDQEFIKEILDTFKQNIVADFEILEQHAANKEFEEASVIAHKMKSSFKMLHIDKASNICQRIEDQNSNTEITKEIGLLQKLISEAIQEVAVIKQKF